MNISLPEPMKQFVDGLVASGRYSTASEYVRELIRADERRRSEAQLEALLVAGLQGEGTIMSPADWQALRKEALSKVKARKSHR